MNAETGFDPAAAARRFFDAYGAHDVEKMLALCSDDARLRYVPLGKFGEGPVRTVGRKIWQGLITMLPDLTVSTHSLTADSGAAAAEVIIADERRGYRLPHAFLLRFERSGKIVEVVAYWDNLNFAFQSIKALAGSISKIGAAMRGRTA